MTDRVNPTTKINDLCSNCLLSVFQYLSVTDLANLSEANITGKLGKRNYNDRYKQCIVKAFKVNVKMNKMKTFVHVDVRYAVDDMKMLRNFGSEIEHLVISYWPINRRYEHSLEDLISRNCWKTLPYIEFERFDIDAMNQLQRSFMNVQLAEFRDGHLGSTLGQLKKWFPNVVDLRFTDTYVFDTKCIHEHFPQLTSIAVWNDLLVRATGGKMIFTNSDLKVFILLNPQLKALSIRHDNVDETESGGNAIIIDWEFVTFINENLRLEKLELNLEKFRFDRKWKSTITIDSLTALHVHCENGDCLDKYKIATPNLNKLKLNVEFGDDKRVNYEAIATFVIQTQPTLLEINAEYQKFAVDNVQVLKMTRMLPSLQEIVIKCLWIDALPDAILNLLVNSCSLNKLVGVFIFHLDGSDGPEFEKMREIFRAKITRNDAVANQWIYKFEYEEAFLEIDSVQFQRKEQIK